MNPIKIVYDFAFPDGGSKAYTVELDRASLSYRLRPRPSGRPRGPGSRTTNAGIAR